MKLVIAILGLLLIAAVATGTAAAKTPDCFNVNDNPDSPCIEVHDMGRVTFRVETEMDYPTCR